VVCASFSVTGVHGLHARPAARLVTRIRDLRARVELRNLTTGSAWVGAASVSRVAALAARTGHVLQVRAEGEQAQDAVAALVALAQRGFDEPPQITGGGEDLARPWTPREAPREAPCEAPPAPSPQTPSSTFPGASPGASGDASAAPPTPAAPALGASAGIALGPIRHDRARIGPDHAGPALPPAGPPTLERQNLIAAIRGARSRILRLRDTLVEQGMPDEAGIFDVHLALLEDPDLVRAGVARIDTGVGAPAAWAASVAETAARLADLDDPYLAARAADVHAVGDQVLAELLPPETPAEPPVPSGGSGSADGESTEKDQKTGILVVAELTPQRAAHLGTADTPGVIMAYGSPNGHAAILLRARGIPALTGAGPGILALAEGTVVAFDGSTGELAIDPDQDTRRSFTGRADRARQAAARAAREAHTPARTRDGVRILVGANIAGPAQAAAARSAGADLVGLVRTEFLFMDRQQAPDVDEQEAAYLGLAEAFGGGRITLRTLDVGGDKPLRYLPGAAEANPFLGLRGLRLGLRRPQLLTDQLRAIVRTARRTPVSVLFPMVSTLAEVHAARAALDRATDGQQLPTGLRVGIMIEVPAAALRSATLAGSVDFFSIGTNDLTQYTLAAERGNDAVAALGDPFDPAVLQLVRATCAGAAGRAQVAVCGEFAADPRAVPLLVGLGVTELSVTPAAVAITKQVLRGIDTGRAGAIARRALDLASAEEVRAELDPPE